MNLQNLLKIQLETKIELLAQYVRESAPDLDIITIEAEIDNLCSLLYHK